jgi:hypothetical protein
LASDQKQRKPYSETSKATKGLQQTVSTARNKRRKMRKDITKKIKQKRIIIEKNKKENKKE